jgi:predicted transcriptional regulator
MDRVDPEVALRMATEIVVAYLGKSSVEPDRLASLVREVRTALSENVQDFDPISEIRSTPYEASPAGSGLAEAVPPSAIVSGSPTDLRPAVTPDASITPDFLISLEDGKPYRSLKRHLMAQYGMTPDQYRQKWGLAPDYPMVAPSYAAERSEVAKRIGLGRRKPAPIAKRAPVLGKGATELAKASGRSKTPARRGPSKSQNQA